MSKISIDTIAAPSTGRGGATAVVRISGDKAIEIADSIFISKELSSQKGFTLHYGEIVSELGDVIDDVILSLFRAPHSYTGEDMVEISVHASDYILNALLAAILSKGGRMADPGEFTMRAYCNGKMDLVQAEAVADIISSTTASSHRLATNQMRGGYSKEFSILRTQLLDIMSLIELELDFGEEDVEFADRSRLSELLSQIRLKVDYLTSSFIKGNAIKNGVPVVIAGRPNAGKSTLLNALLHDDRAMVSDIAGTTRDIIEEVMTLGGVQFRFIDTAGIRATSDKLEVMGIERAWKAMRSASVILYVVDVSDDLISINEQLRDIEIGDDQQFVVVMNKCDKCDIDFETHFPLFKISARDGNGISELENFLMKSYGAENIGEGSVIISNMRHYELLKRSGESIARCENGIRLGLTSDLLAQELRETSYYIGSITGDISTDEVLGNIFAHFCIGK